MGDILPVLQLALLQPCRQLLEALGETLGEAGDQEALYLRLLDDQLTQPARARLGLLQVGLRALPADGNPRSRVDQSDDRVGDGPALVVEVDIDARGAELLERAAAVRLAPAVERGVEAELVEQPRGRGVGAGRPDDAAALDLRDLTDQHPHRTGRLGHHHSFTRLWVGDVQQAEERREPGQAEHSESRRDRAEAGVDLSQLAPRGDGELLPSQDPFDGVAGQKRRIQRLHHEGDRAAGHDVSDANQPAIGSGTAHPPSKLGLE